MVDDDAGIRLGNDLRLLKGDERNAEIRAENRKELAEVGKQRHPFLLRLVVDEGAQVHPAGVRLLGKAVSRIAAGDGVLIDRVKALAALRGMQRAVVDARIRVFSIVAEDAQKQRIGQGLAELGKDDSLLGLVLAGVVAVKKIGKGKAADFVLHLKGFVIVARGLHAHQLPEIIQKRHVCTSCGSK